MITHCFVSSLWLKQLSKITSLQREDVEIPLHSAEGWLTHALLALCSWFCGKAMHMARDTGWSKLLTPGQEGKKVGETGTGVLSSLQEHMLHAPIGLKSSINLLS